MGLAGGVQLGEGVAELLCEEVTPRARPLPKLDKCWASNLQGSHRVSPSSTLQTCATKESAGSVEDDGRGEEEAEVEETDGHAGLFPQCELTERGLAVTGAICHVVAVIVWWYCTWGGLEGVKGAATTLLHCHHS